MKYNLNNRWLISTFAAIMSLLITAGFAQADDKVTFDDHIKPLLQKRCSSCHNPNKKSADLDVTNYTNLMQGGASGPVIEPGDPSSSYLYLLITHEETPIMPPGENSKLPDPSLALMEKWITTGALENQGSKARIMKPKFDLAVSGSATERPAAVSIPPKMIKEPTIQTPRSTAVPAIATSPWAAVAALASQKQILLYNTNSLEFIGVLPFPEGQPTVIKFSRTGALLMAAGGQHGAGGKVYVWDVKTAKRLFTIGDEIDNVLAADISPDHTKIALGGPQKMIRVYSTTDGSLLYEVKKHTDWVTALEFSPDGVLLATGDRSGGLHVWESETGTEYLTLNGHSKMISDISWRHDSNIVASACDDTTIKLWEVENGRQVKSWGAHGAGTTSMDFLRDGNIVSSGRDKIAKIWQQDGKLVRQFTGLPDETLSVAYCNETGKVICSDWSGINRVWHAADGAHRADFSGNPPTLAQRVAESQKKFDESKAKHQPLLAQVSTTVAQIVKIVSGIQAAQQVRTKSEAAMNDANGKLGVAKKQFDATQAEQTTLQGELTKKQTARPMVEQSRQMAAKALAALPGDKELTATQAALASKLAALDARIAELTQLVAQAEQKKTTTQKQMTDLATMVQTSKTEMEAASKKMLELETQKTPLVAQQTKQEQAATEAASQVAFWQNSVSRWQSEISFRDALFQLEKQLATANVDASQRDVSLQEAELKLAEAQKIAADHRAAKQSAQQKVSEIQAKISELQEIN